MKSKTCVGKVSNKPLEQFHNEDEANKSAEYVHQRYGKIMVPYKCTKCSYWHLSPKSRQTPSFKCAYCTDSMGDYKSTYRSEAEAELRASIIYNDHRICLKVYECEFGHGWHLTKDI